ncbi:MAG TPA: 30S ribosomal protein S18 [bacterium]|nr:30S ribosomal protein S18 [bacterium]HOL66824.1 30S ribosomal protein S18 [bacterium]HPP11514.1 30S ribosomal protein S18 [bacterium]
MKRKAKICQFCKEKVTEIDYKDIGKIRRFVSGRGKILSARMTGTCNRHQRMLARAVKRARFVALLPYIQI